MIPPVLAREAWRAALVATKGTPAQRWTYRRYLRSASWKTTPARREALARARGRCERCGKRRRGLHPHHLTYRRVGRERAADFLVLCAACHRDAHAKQ